MTVYETSVFDIVLSLIIGVVLGWLVGKVWLWVNKE